MKNEFKLLLGALAQAVANKPFEIPEDVDWQLFLRLANAHNVGALAYYGLQNKPIPQDIRNALSTAFHRAIYRDSQLEYRKAGLEEALTKANIPHIFLKGAILKYSYPVPALRTMCDLDILVYTKDYPAIDEISKALGGKAGHSDGNHKNYSFPEGVTVEFHPNLLHHGTPIGTEINPGWQYAEKNTLTPEGTYLNTICHLANHFVSGGVGVRFVLDVWVNRHLHKPAFDKEFVDHELAEFGLLGFAKHIEQLSDYWFGNGEKTPLLQELGQYILTSGSHGTTDRAILNALSLSPGGNRASALWKKAFYPRQELEDRFPWCKGKPLLLPAAWCVRAYNAVTQHGSLIAKWGKTSKTFTKEEIQTQRDKLKRFGIRD